MPEVDDLTFEGHAYTNPRAELAAYGGLASAIADAAMQAAEKIDRDTTFVVGSITIEVKPNPGPHAYSATIQPAGSP